MNRYEKLMNDNELKEVVGNIEGRGINVILVNTRTEALEKIKKLIPKNSEVYNGGSSTLNEIGFLDYLKTNKHGWINLHEEILREKDPKKQADLRRKSVTSEYFLGRPGRCP